METENYLLILADRLKELRTTKDDLNEKLKTVNAKIDETEESLIQEMANNEMSKFDRDGTLFSLRVSKHSSMKPEEKSSLYSELKEQGYEDLFTINSQTFNSFVKEQMEENNGELPSWMEGKVSVFEKTTIQLRKS